MKLGINTLFLLARPFEDGLRWAKGLGARCIEVACLGDDALRYCDIDKLLADEDELKRWLAVFEELELEISAFTAHGNGLSPDKAEAEGQSRKFRKICKLAQAAGADRLTLNAGVPEGAPGDKCPLWVVDSANARNRAILRYQWEQRVIPYWQEHGKIAQDHGLKLCFEPWIGDMVHSPATLMKLRDAVGPYIGCNLDPSHLFVQHIDVLETIRFLGDSLWHVHLKDTRIDDHNLPLKGLMDTTSVPAHPEQRPWTFTIVGWGHDERFWQDFMVSLQLINYKGAMSVEMECDYMNVDEGLERQFALLNRLVLAPPPAEGQAWWEIAGLPFLVKD